MKMRFVASKNEIIVLEKEKLIDVPCSINSRLDLFNFYNKEFEFPSYFGQNWDAFYDCLSDLSWLDIKGVLLFHSALPQLNKEDMAQYVRILNDITKDRTKDDVSFKIFFHKNNESAISKMLSS